jgi:hypothetical protein
VKKAYYIIFVIGISLGASSAWAQGSGGQDSTGVENPQRPRRDTYIIEPFPSPAFRGQIVKIQFYNHNPQQVRLLIVDINDKIITELQPPATLANGIHSYDFKTVAVATGTYHIRLITYTPTGAEDIIQDSRFIVLH